MSDHRKLRAFELADNLVVSVCAVAQELARQADETAKVLAGLLRALRPTS